MMGAMTAVSFDSRPTSTAAATAGDADRELLRRYVRDGSHAAFATLVERHVGMVYAAVRRQLRADAPMQAEDVVQAVFILLARKAQTIGPAVSVSGWLYNAARMTAANARRAAARRRHYEHEAGEAMREQLAGQTSTTSAAAADSAEIEWRDLEPKIDDAMSRLRPRDREAIVLRFLSAKSLREVGDATGVSEDAARVRVARALSRLRQLMGVTAPVAALTIALDAAAAHAATAPSELVARLAPAALSPVAGSPAATLAGATAATMMLQLQLKLAAALAIAAILMIGVIAAAAVIARPAKPIAATAPVTARRPALANSPRAVAIAIMDAAAVGDRETMRRFAVVDDEQERRFYDVGIENLIAQAQLDSALKSRFTSTRGFVTPFQENRGFIENSVESIRGDGTAVLTVANGPLVFGFVRDDGGQWKMRASETLLQGLPKQLIPFMIARTNAFTRVMQDTAAEIDAGQYLTAAEVNNAFSKRMQSILATPIPSVSTTQAAAAAAGAAATQFAR
jgi:RNA polymerase sigma factor (sigma-70 family)